ncbi:TPA: hypothetical protein ACM34U_002317, partial [Escherichia coli]
ALSEHKTLSISWSHYRFVEEIAPDECWEGWSEDTEHGWVEVPVGMHPVTCWWD